MKSIFNRIHNRIGDLWWYSAMIFIACRLGDIIQAFIGLWLVPKYVGPNELGAVIPLLQISSFLAIPLGIIAVVFAKYVNTYATRGEYGKVKSFINDVFRISFFLFLLSILVAAIIMPFFYERLRIASGSLTFLILLCGIVTNLGAIITSAQQGLKRFKMMSLMTLVSAPIRLVTLLIAMPFRALSGYILGQTTPPGATSFFSFLDIKSFLKPYDKDTSWRKDIPEIWCYLWPYAICSIIGAFFGAIVATVYRQRLPEIESSAYYILTRFAEIAGYIGASMNAILVPLASESYERKKENSNPLRHVVTTSLLSSVALAIVFYFSGDYIFSISETWVIYKPYLHLLPIMTISAGMGMATISVVSYEFACRRIMPTVVLLILNVIWAILLVSFSGYSYFNGFLPHCIVKFMAEANVNNLTTITWYSFFATNLIQLPTVLWLSHRNISKKNLT